MRAKALRIERWMHLRHLRFPRSYGEKSETSACLPNAVCSEVPKGTAESFRSTVNIRSSSTNVHLGSQITSRLDCARAAMRGVLRN